MCIHNRLFLYLILGLIGMLVVSCSSGGGDPLLPGVNSGSDDGTPLLQREPLTPADWVGHEPMVFCTLVFNLEENTIEVIENRTAAPHFNIRPLLEDPFWCPNLNCLNATLIGIDPVEKIYTVKVNLRNPTYMTGFDVRGIMYLNPMKDTDLLNPDDYSDLYDPLAQINPFRAFAKLAPDRQFPPQAEYNEIYEIHIPPPPPLFNINYAIDVAWPNNCREPYDIEEITYSGALSPSGGSGTITCRVYDHQDNIESVKVDLHGITGSVVDLIYDPVDDLWSLTFSNTTGAGIGEYKCLLSAKSVDYEVQLYNYVTVEVIPGADQYIIGRVFDAYTMVPLDGAEVSIVNQDIFGFQPPLEYVSGGMYTVAVDPGIYNMQISTVGYDIMTCVGVDVTPGENYEIDFGLNMDEILSTSPLPFTGGLTGKVTDAGTGQPLPEAAVVVKSNDINDFADPHPDFVGGAACKESGYYSATGLSASLDNFTYMPASQWAVYCSAPGYEAVEISGGFMVEDDVVVPNMHFQLSPIETGKTVIFHEDFEGSTGWTYELYAGEWDTNVLHLWGVKQWDSSIINISVENGWTYLAPDEDDGGIIPQPPVNSYNPGPNEMYLWYGDENQGCFLGPYNVSDQFPGDGGSSIDSHGGWAISPDIDLTGYSNGLLAFESFWEIESQDPDTYDRMEVFIRDDSGFDYPLDFLNPAIDPGTSGDPISTGGHFRDGVWNHLVYDISPYMGNSSANIVFRFSTEDSLYNGFKGWFLDNIYVYGY